MNIVDDARKRQRHAFGVWWRSVWFWQLKALYSRGWGVSVHNTSWLRPLMTKFSPWSTPSK